MNLEVSDCSLVNCHIVYSVCGAVHQIQQHEVGINNMSDLI